MLNCCPRSGSRSTFSTILRPLVVCSREPNGHFQTHNLPSSADALIRASTLLLPSFLEASSWMNKSRVCRCIKETGFDSGKFVRCSSIFKAVVNEFEHNFSPACRGRAAKLKAPCRLVKSDPCLEVPEDALVLVCPVLVYLECFFHG